MPFSLRCFQKQEQTQPDMSWNSQLNSCSAASNYPLESVEMYFLTFWKLYILYVLESATCTMTACTLHQENGDKEQNDLKEISSTSNVVRVPKYTYLSAIQIWKAYRATNNQIHVCCYRSTRGQNWKFDLQIPHSDSGTLSPHHETKNCASGTLPTVQRHTLRPGWKRDLTSAYYFDPRPHMIELSNIPTNFPITPPLSPPTGVDWWKFHDILYKNNRIKKGLEPWWKFFWWFWLTWHLELISLNAVSLHLHQRQVSKKFPITLIMPYADENFSLFSRYAFPITDIAWYCTLPATVFWSWKWHLR